MGKRENGDWEYHTVADVIESLEERLHNVRHQDQEDASWWDETGILLAPNEVREIVNVLRRAPSTGGTP